MPPGDVVQDYPLSDELHGGATDAIAPIFILCAARSGSTLLRYFLDAHPEIGCPPETNLAAALEAVQFALGVSRDNDEEMSEWQARTDAFCRRLADEIYQPYLKRGGKKRWCDKSLLSIERTESLGRIFPTARFLCLHRHCLDMIASGLEASPHGLGAYGFDFYARETPLNAVWALGRYWADRAEAALAFEEANPHRCLRIRYEDFVRDPHAILTEVCRFLSVDSNPAFFDRELVFGPRIVTGPQDYKIVYSRDVDSSSVGRGWTVPLEMLPSPLIERINEIHHRLGYGRLEDVLEQSRVTASTTTDREPRMASIESVIDARVRPRLAARATTTADEGAVANLVVANRGVGWHINLVDRTVSEVVDDTVSEAASPAATTVLSDERTLLAIANGEVHPAVAMRRGQLRLQLEFPADPESAPHAESLAEAVVALLTP